LSAQSSIPQVLKRRNDSLCKVSEISREKQYCFLDAREPKEVSHIQDAILVGYFNSKKVEAA
jgi:hypothetical protein